MTGDRRLPIPRGNPLSCPIRNLANRRCLLFRWQLYMHTLLMNTQLAQILRSYQIPANLAIMEFSTEASLTPDLIR